MRAFVRLGGGSGDRWAEERNGSWRILAGAPWADDRPTGEELSEGELPRLAPVTPSKIVCVGLNYALHVAESQSRSTPPEEPILFLKPPSALLDPEAAILLPPVGRVDHEAELALIVGRRLRDATEAEARQGIFGVTALNDVTARELQRRDGQWARAKGFDTFCPVGPRLLQGLDPDHLAVASRVNGEPRQSGHTKDFLFPSGRLVAFISAVMTLEPGDVISTGTPAGVGPLEDGDRVEIEVEGVGVLVNPVRRRTRRDETAHSALV